MTEVPAVARIWVAHSDQLQNRDVLIVECIYMSRPSSVLVFRYENECFGYLNKCVHMPFRLDCEHKQVFDFNKDKIKCSMHGIIYEPTTGVSLSPTMCTGEKLTPICIAEVDGGIWIYDEKIEPLTNKYLGDKADNKMLFT